MNPSFSSKSFTPDKLHAGDYPIRTLQATLITGQNLNRGAVLGKITASGKLKLSLSAAVDGSQDVYAILAEDMDATSEDKTVTIYVAGDFNSNAMTFGADHTADSTRDAFRDLGIYVVDGVTA